MSTITITFCDVAENHLGMQKSGNLHSSGYTVDFLKMVEEKCT